MRKLIFDDPAYHKPLSVWVENRSLIRYLFLYGMKL